MKTLNVNLKTAKLNIEDMYVITIQTTLTTTTTTMPTTTTTTTITIPSKTTTITVTITTKKLINK